MHQDNHKQTCPPPHEVNVKPMCSKIKLDSYHGEADREKIVKHSKITPMINHILSAYLCNVQSHCITPHCNYNVVLIRGSFGSYVLSPEDCSALLMMSMQMSLFYL